MERLTGRTLDAEVAQRLFGLTVEQRENKRTHQQDFVYEVHPGQWVQVAYYSEHGSAWLNVVSELSKRGWMRVTAPRLGSQWNKPGDSTVVFQHADGRRVEAHGLVNEAICRAALEAVSQ